MLLATLVQSRPKASVLTQPQSLPLWLLIEAPPVLIWLFVAVQLCRTCTEPQSLCRTTYFLSSFIFPVLKSGLCVFGRLLWRCLKCLKRTWKVYFKRTFPDLWAAEITPVHWTVHIWVKRGCQGAVFETLMCVDQTWTSTPLWPLQLSYFSCIICHYSGYCLLFFLMIYWYMPTDSTFAALSRSQQTIL